MVMYQHDWTDGFFHRYSYDAENRLTLVETSRDSLVWEKDARYEYYRHGPLARVTLGDQLQGINLALTNALHIRGSVIINWLKLHNKRQVQYMAGHKYISSTEAYAIQDLDTLQDELSKHHPFG